MNQEIIGEQIVTELEKAIFAEKITRAQHLFQEAEELDWIKLPDSLNQRYRAAMNQLTQLTE